MKPEKKVPAILGRDFFIVTLKEGLSFVKNNF